MGKLHDQSFRVVLLLLYTLSVFFLTNALILTLSYYYWFACHNISEMLSIVIE
jgi:hypothetical protein